MASNDFYSKGYFSDQGKRNCPAFYQMGPCRATTSLHSDFGRRLPLRHLVGEKQALIAAPHPLGLSAWLNRCTHQLWLL